MSRAIFMKRKMNRGQSFIELMLVALALAFMLVGVVEFGFLMNAYMITMNASREAARFAANSVAIDDNGQNIQKFYVDTAIRALISLCASPSNCQIIFEGDKGDDIVISVFSLAGSSVVRFPNSTGWSLCANYTDQLFYPPYRSAPPVSLSDPTKWDECTPHTSRFSTADVASLRNPAAPPSGIVLVEIFYNYPQTLGLPIFADFLNPIPAYLYSAMPLSSAEPTPTPQP